MIKESIIFEGTPGDDITDAITVATSKAKELNEDVFIRWNGATVRVSPYDDENDILSDYDVELNKIDLYIDKLCKDNDLIFIEKDEPISMEDLANRLQLLREALASNDDEKVRAAMRKVVPTYRTPEEVNCKAEQSAEMQNVRVIK